MNFYIGNSIDDVNQQDENVEFSDELLDFLYKLRKHELFDMSKLYEIDPYDDVELSSNDVLQIVKICNYIIENSLLVDYEEPDEGVQMVQELAEIAQKALSRNIGLVSMGD